MRHEGDLAFDVDPIDPGRPLAKHWIGQIALVGPQFTGDDPQHGGLAVGVLAHYAGDLAELQAQVERRKLEIPAPHLGKPMPVERAALVRCLFLQALAQPAECGVALVQSAGAAVLGVVGDDAVQQFEHDSAWRAAVLRRVGIFVAATGLK